ncbi:sigma-54 dependent transcriptional regulator [Aurantivibrio infirmus]
MPQPSLLIYIDDRDLEKQFLENKVIRQFNTQRISEDESWIDALIDTSPSAGIIQADNLSEPELTRIVKSSLLSKTDLVFISRGEPNPYIDQAMQRGVSLHLRTPIDMEFVNEFLSEIYQDVSQSQSSTEEVVASDLAQFGLLVGSSTAMRRLYRLIRKAAESNVNVFIVGESGAGKELVANTIHLTSPSSNQPFVAINCGALSPELIESELFGHVKGAFTGANKDRAGVFEQAEGGTLFLDEVTEMPIDHQVKLLRVLETGEFKPVGSDQTKIANVRVVSATNRDPSEAIQDELFREDLYFRLAHFPICVPPLRDRDGDIVGLAKHFLAYRNTEEQLAKTISKDTISIIENHEWPGNVRELKHAIERAYILADDVITNEHLIIEEVATNLSANQELRETLPHGIPLEEVEKGVIMKTLSHNDGNKSETADQLGISVKTLYNKLEKYEKSD